MKRKLQKFAVVLMAVIFLLPTMVFADTTYENLDTANTEYTYEQPNKAVGNPADILNIYVPPGIQ